MPKHLILCDCLGSQHLDAEALAQASGQRCSRVHSALCSFEIAQAESAIAAGEALIACGQEMARFTELAEDLGLPAPDFVDLRDRAGWSDDPAPKLAKMTALLAEAALTPPPVKSVDVLSAGACLIIGASAVALPAAGRLAEVLAVTVLLTDEAPLPDDRRFEVIRGRLAAATGTLGDFTLRLDALQQVQPGGRGPRQLTPPRDGAETRCDVILDLSGAAPLFPAHHKRDGYLRADPGDPRLVADKVFEAAQHVGTFEKPLHVRMEAHLCAHSRAGQTGCTRCLDLCPTGAIRPDGEHVSIDPLVCAGCGACSSACPSGAILYDAPPVDFLLQRIRVLAEAFRAAGGRAPRLLVHDADHGAEMVALAARHGRGLPADVIPLAVPALAGFGHAEMLAALASGFAQVVALPGPRTERPPLEAELALAVAMAAAQDRLAILDTSDPEAMSEALYAAAPPPPVAPVLAMGGRRQVARLSAKALLPAGSGPIPLPAGAPYGAVLVDREACTLCLSCVSLCPSGALLDNPDKPQLRFQQDACLQCGICASACPEDAITLAPEFDPTDAALSQRVLNEEEPYCCIECGKPFGVRSTVEKIVERLSGKHPMFADSATGRLIRMCDDCRVRAQYHDTDNPMAAAARPRMRTTDDYLSKRRDH